MFAHELYIVVCGVFCWWCPSVYFAGYRGADKEMAVLLDMRSHDDERCTYTMEDVFELFEVFILG